MRTKTPQATWGRFLGHWAIIGVLCALQLNPAYSFTHGVLQADSRGLRAFSLLATCVVGGLLLWRVWRLHAYHIPNWTYGVGLPLLGILTTLWWYGIIAWENNARGWMSLLAATFMLAVWSYGPAIHMRLAAAQRRYQRQGGNL